VATTANTRPASTEPADHQARAVAFSLPGLLAFGILKILIVLTALPGYGWFRDEFYYLACARRLSFGYVDHPPLAPLVLRATVEIFGDSLWTVRILAALIGAAVVIVIGLIAREMGGGRFAQALAMVCTIAAPQYLGMHYIFSMNVIETLLWAAAALVFVRLLRQESPRLWILLGVLLGLGLQNKISMLWLGFGLVVGLLISGRWRTFLSPWPWVAAAVAGIIFVPHVVWQIANGWPTIEFVRNATANKITGLSVLGFAGAQLLIMHPVIAPIWIGGLAWLLFAPGGRRFRPLGVAYLAVFALLALGGSSKPYYLSAAYTWLFAAGGTVVEAWSARSGRLVVRAALLFVIVVAGAITAPLAIPVLPARAFISYSARLGIEPPREENHEMGALPQFFADMHGWDRIVEAMEVGWRALSDEERNSAIIFVQNYGEAGAIERLGAARGLPSPFSGHNNYWLWGPPARVVRHGVVLGGNRDDLDRNCGTVEVVATTDCGYCMPYENRRPIYVCRNLRVSLTDLWPRLRNFN
jgi:hypothetical protein